MRTRTSPLTRWIPMGDAPVTEDAEGHRRFLTLALPQQVEFEEFIGQDDQCHVSGRLELDLAALRYELVQLKVSAPSIGPELLRGVQVQALMETVLVSAVRRHAQVFQQDDDGVTTKELADQLTDEETVVAMWHLARATRSNPNPLIREQLRLPSDQAAARRVAALRKAGVLPAAEKKGQRY